jgi:hypothetical protein
VLKTSFLRFILACLLGLFSAASRELQNAASGEGRRGYVRFSALQHAAKRVYNAKKYRHC